MTRANPFATDDPWEATAIDGDDPFGDEDPFDNQRDGFAKVEWVIDRLVLVWPTELLTDLPGSNNKPYSSMVSRIVVLDGPVNENIEKIPFEIQPFRWNADSIIDSLKHLVGSRKPKLARVRETPSKHNKLIMARYFAAPTDEDRALARKYLASTLHTH